MRRNFLRGLLICLVPTLLAAGFIGWAAYEEADAPKRAEARDAEKQAALAEGRPPPADRPEGWHPRFRRGIDLAGGTILIYETLERQANERELEARDIRTLADKLKQRIDPTDVKNVVVRPLGHNRVEIILPFVGGSGGKEKVNEEFIADVRDKVKQTGVLEFRILANDADDAAGLEAARRLIDDPTDDTARKALTDKAAGGEPPPAPEGTYLVKAAGEVEVPVQYKWVELGKEEREGLGLSQTPQAGKPRSGLFEVLKGRRNQTYMSGGGTDPDGSRTSSLLYSRPFTKRPDLRTKDEDGKEVEYFLLTRVSDADALAVVNDVKLTASVGNDAQHGVVIHFSFNSGGNRFHDLTRRNRRVAGLARQMAIVMDGKLVSAPRLNEPLPGQGQIYGNYDTRTANQLVSILKSGSLNASLKPDPVSENKIGATLGDTTIRAGLLAVAAAFAVVLAFMVVYYRFAGLVACVALFVNLLMTVGFMVAMNAAFTLPGLAGIVLMLGMAVDANVLIYERLREEREKGATLAAAIRNGYDRALLTIIDTHLTSIFTSIVLYTFGNDALKGFSVSLTVGLIISLFTSLYITRLLFDYWLHKRWLTQLRMLKLFARPSFDFMKVRWPMIALTGALTVLGLILFLARGEKVLNVDFTQGTAYGGRLAEGKERSLGELLALLGEDGQKKGLVVKDAAKAAVPGWVYDVEYADGQRTRVTFVTPPEGATDAARLLNVRERLSGLPDVSVEQVFIGTDQTALPAGKSRSFTVRTTEKEKEVVQVILDRLLKDGKAPLLATASAQPLKVEGSKVLVTFDLPPGEVGISPAYFQDFVVRELQAAGVPDKSAAAVKVSGKNAQQVRELRGEPAADADKQQARREGQEQKYQTLQVDLSGVPEYTEGLNAPARAEATRGEIAARLTAAVDAFKSRPVPERLETFDPSLAAETRGNALKAILLSWLAILAFLWFRFGSWRHGLAAVLCLVHDLCFTLGAIAVCHYLHDTVVGHALLLRDFKIDLTAVAALLTLVGYSVNEIIVNFARLREVRGKNPTLTPNMINQSVNQTLSRTILTSMTVLLVSGVLYWFGGEGVHLFAFVMVMGVLISTYSSIYVASPLLLIFGEGKPKVPTPGGPGGGPDADRPAEAAPVSAIAS